VTVKGSTQPMGLFTYDITLERVSPPPAAPSGDAAVSEDAAGLDSALDVETFSHGSYDNEFEEHPDLTQCAAALLLFAGFAVLRLMPWHCHAIISAG